MQTIIVSGITKNFIVFQIFEFRKLKKYRNSHLYILIQSIIITEMDSTIKVQILLH